MSDQTTINTIKLLGVTTLCLSFLSLFGLAYLKLIDPAPLVSTVLVGVGTLIGFIFERRTTEAKVNEERAKAAATVAEMQMEIANAKTK